MLVTSLAAGNPIPTTEENDIKPIDKEKDYLIGSSWTHIRKT
jgi:hypothetical protein